MIGNRHRMMGAIALLIALLLSGSLLPAMSSESAKLSGTITYQSSSQLPPQSTVFVTLVDVSPREDASGEIHAKQIINHPTSGVISFELSYDPTKIFADRLYAIQVQIRADGKLLFRNLSGYPVLTQGSPKDGIDVIVESVN